MDLFTILRVKAELDGIATVFAKDLELIIRAKEIKSSEVVLALVTVHMGIDGRWHGSPVVKLVPYRDIIDLLGEEWDTCDIEIFKKWYTLKTYENSKILVVIVGNVGIPYEASAYAFPPLNQLTPKPKAVEGEYSSSAVAPQHRKEVITKETQSSNVKVEKPASDLEIFIGLCGLITLICFSIGGIIIHFFDHNSNFAALLLLISVLSFGLAWLVDVIFNGGKSFQSEKETITNKNITSK